MSSTTCSMFEIRVESSGFIDTHETLISPTHFKSENSGCVGVFPQKSPHTFRHAKKHLPTLRNGLRGIEHILVSFFEISHSYLTFQPLGLTRMSTIFCDFFSSLKLSVKFGNYVLRFSYPREKKLIW